MTTANEGISPSNLSSYIASNDAEGLGHLRQAYAPNDVPKGVTEGLIICSVLEGNRGSAGLLYRRLYTPICRMSRDELETEAMRASHAGFNYIAAFARAIMKAHENFPADYHPSLDEAHEVSGSIPAEVLDPFFDQPMGSQAKENLVKATIDAAVAANNPDTIKVLCTQKYAQWLPEADVINWFYTSCSAGHVEVLDALFESNVWNRINCNMFYNCAFIAKGEKNRNILNWFCAKDHWVLGRARQLSQTALDEAFVEDV